MPKQVLLICPVVIMSLIILTGPCTEAQDNTPKQTVPTRKLPRNRRREAGVASDRADLMRARFERQLAPSDHSKPKESQTETLEAEVVEAYEDVIEKYAHTDIAAYCAMRLAGFYRRLGHVDKSLRLLEATASEFEGTHEASKVMYETGLFHAQVRKDQASAREWFKRIPDPSPPAPNDRDSQDMMTQ